MKLIDPTMDGLITIKPAASVCQASRALATLLFAKHHAGNTDKRDGTKWIRKTLSPNLINAKLLIANFALNILFTGTGDINTDFFVLCVGLIFNPHPNPTDLTCQITALFKKNAKSRQDYKYL